MNKQLRHYRHQHGLKLEDVAFILDIPEIDYAVMENGSGEVPLKLLVKLCRFYGIKAEDLLEPSPAKKSRPEVSAPAETAAAPAREYQPPKTVPVKRKAAREDRYENRTIGRDQPHTKVTPKEAVDIFKKHGTVMTEEEAGQVLEFMDKMVRYAVEQYEKEEEWKAKLKAHPEGYLFDISGYACRICDDSGKDGWYDRFGLKCQLCQAAVDKGIIPGGITGDQEQYYNEYELERDFNLGGKTLTRWLREGILKARVITGGNGRSRHYRIFLLADNAGFLPPKAMLECHESVDVEKDGQVWQRSLKWYQCQDDPADYIKDYGIVRYLKFSGGEASGPPDDAHT